MMTTGQPKALLDKFLFCIDADVIGRIEPLSFGLLTKVRLDHVFHALSEDPLKRQTLIISIDSTKLLSKPHHKITHVLEDAIKFLQIDSNDFLIILYTKTNKSRLLHGAIKNLGLCVRPIPEGIVLEAARKAKGGRATAFRRIVLDATKINLLNPYHSNKKAKNRMFFGRKALLRDFKSDSIHFSLFGPRRIGKSSFVYRLQSEMGKLEIKQNLSINCVSYVDVSQLLNPEQDLLSEILRGFGLGPEHFHSFARIKSLMPRSVRDFSLDIDSGTILLNLFKRYPEKLAIVLDEVDAWLDPIVRHKDNLPTLERLKAITDETRARVILVGYENLMLATKSGSFPLTGRHREELLEPLDRDTVNELVLDPLSALDITLEPKDEILSIIWNASVGRPNIVQEICRECIRRIGSEHSNYRRITIPLLEDVILKNVACIRLREIVGNLKDPLSKALAIAATPIEGYFTVGNLLDTLSKFFQPNLQDVDRAMSSLRLRYIFRCSKKNSNNWSWTSEWIRKGAQQYADAYNIERVLSDCVQNYKILQKA